MKEYEKAIATYEKGLGFDPDNQELRDGVLRCRQAINKFMMGTATEDEVKERQAKALSDPEVRYRASCSSVSACLLLSSLSI
jgi:stress-induced-phosphoprotein 1